MGVAWGRGEGFGLFNTRDPFPSELSRQRPRGIFFQVFSFREACAVSAAKRPRAPPAAEGLRGFVSDARLHQLQRWLQPLIKLRAVRARSAETRLLLNRPFRPRCRMIWGNWETFVNKPNALNRSRPFSTFGL